MARPWTDHWLRGRQPVRVGAASCGILDVAENVCLAIVLDRYEPNSEKKLDGWPRAASKLSLAKFFLLILSVGWAVLVLWSLLVP